MRKNWQSFQPPAARTLDKREFMQQYVLARARALPAKANAVGIAEAAGKCFDKIEEICGGKK